MERKNNATKLYFIIDQYLLGKMSAWDFCDEFHNLYNLNIDYDTLSTIEQLVFNDLDDIVSRYTDIIEDLNNYPSVYYDERTLKQKVEESKLKLTTTN